MHLLLPALERLIAYLNWLMLLNTVNSGCVFDKFHGVIIVNFAVTLIKHCSLWLISCCAEDDGLL